jgi:hypothetical protein
MIAYDVRWRRPTSVTVLSILHLVGGCLGLVAALCSGAMQLASGSVYGAAAKQQGFAAAATQVLERVPGQQVVIILSLVAYPALDLVLIIAGIGLLRRQSWARSLSLVYALTSILLHTMGVVWTLAVVMPAMKQLVSAQLAKAPPVQQVAFRAGMIGALVGTHIWVVYPVIVLCILLSPSVKAAFQRGPSPGPVQGEYESEVGGPMRLPGSSDPFGPSTHLPDPDGFHKPPG